MKHITKLAVETFSIDEDVITLWPFHLMRSNRDIAYKTIGKQTCVYCGRMKSFSPYIDNVTGQPLATKDGRYTAGICDHKAHCGGGENGGEYFKSWVAFFRENQDVYKEWYHNTFLPNKQAYIDNAKSGTYDSMKPIGKRSFEIFDKDGNLISAKQSFNFLKQSKSKLGQSFRKIKQSFTANSLPNNTNFDGVNSSISIKLSLSGEIDRVRKEIEEKYKNGSPITWETIEKLDHTWQSEYLKSSNDYLFYKYEENIENNPLFSALVNTFYFDKNKLKTTFEKYKVFTASYGKRTYSLKKNILKTGSMITSSKIDCYTSCFPLIDTEGRIRTGKIMDFDKNAHRGKGFQWIPNLLDNKIPSSYTHIHCLFGEHLLKNYNSETDVVYIVEAEKTSIVMDYAYPQNKDGKNIIWLSTGGCGNLNSERLAILVQDFGLKDVVLYSDKDAVEKWQKKADKTMEYLQALGVKANIQVSDMWKEDKYKNCNDNTDLADLLLDYEVNKVA